MALSAALGLVATDPYLLEDHFKLIGALVLLTIGPTMIARTLGDRPAERIAEEHESRMKVTA